MLSWRLNSAKQRDFCRKVFMKLRFSGRSQKKLGPGERPHRVGRADSWADIPLLLATVSDVDESSVMAKPIRTPLRAAADQCASGSSGR